MKNKFDIWDLFFRVKRKKEKIKDKEKKEKEKVIINYINENKDQYIYPDTTPTPFFVEENKSQDKTKKDKRISTLVLEEDKIKKETNEDEVIEINLPIKENIDNTISIKNRIIEEIEKNLKEDYYRLNNIKYELSTIKKEEEKELSLDEVNNLIEKLNALIKQFEKLKREFYKNNYDKINELGIDDKYINELIIEYKTALKNNDIESAGLIQIKEIEEYIDILNNIAVIEDDSYKINEDLSSKLQELNITDKEMDEFEQKYNNMEKITRYINAFSNEQENIINNIEKKVAQSTKITKKAEYQTDLIIDYSKLLSSTLLMATTAMIPQTKTGNMLKIGLIVAAIANMSRIVKTSTKEAKVTTYISKIDYSSSIKSSLGNISDMDTLIYNSLNDIKYMRQSFKSEFEQYKNVMSEYASMLSKLDSIEKELIVKQQLAKTYENKLNDVLEKNNVKVKRLEEEYKNH